ncbi:dTDP-4-dehydrorhamnose 3,5-epimerase [Cohnella sp. REN36]|uniref:dTDP-4-dehydrorhamnose 3,5-epimerase n=1 Tax=Cohnella sp. REN36 TaxID=2887347 RepID=UPI001D145E87|nr:dTDP-4-dehydrorhamnose 3,5-epimerase [Cohnella sp. REN36]MCC3374093.1 dTDP-4-dehydrorhamnose 3,5-epimerase [Cohnella sp. REN36]
MKVIEGRLPGVRLIEPVVHGDHRGFFLESYNRERMVQHGLAMEFVQDNHSLSVEPGVLRGLHYQLTPKAQTKLVRVVAGAIFDVVVDIRKGSSTFGQWEGYELSAENKRQLLVPQGFAHGFCTLVPNTEVLYKVDELYSSQHDRGIRWDDPEIGIQWPIQTPILSDKDKNHPGLLEADNNFVFAKDGI